jgi:hypothetical protein
MEAEPPKADPPKRKRRRFQFRLRTLMIVVTLLAVPCGYIGWQARIVRERRDLLASQFVKSSINDGNGSMSWIRRSTVASSNRRNSAARSTLRSISGAWGPAR